MMDWATYIRMEENAHAEACPHCGEPLEDDEDSLGYRTPEGEACHRTDGHGHCVQADGSALPSPRPERGVIAFGRAIAITDGHRATETGEDQADA